MTIFPSHKLRSLACITVLLLVNSAAQAAIAITCADYIPTGTEICLEDGNSIFVIDSLNGVQTLNVDGNDHIFFQDFLYDNLLASGGQGDELGMDGYPNLTSTAVGTNTLSLTYSKNNNPTIQLDFTLTGGILGTDTATIDETFTFTNNTGSLMDLYFFAYTDVDLGGPLDSGDDQGEVLSTTSYRQFDDTYQLVASTDPAVDAWQVGFADAILLELYDGVNTLFPSTPTVGGTIGPGDLQMVYQYIVSLADGESFSYTQSFTISPVAVIPVPAAVWLFGSGLLGLVGFARKNAAV